MSKSVKAMVWVAVVILGLLVLYKIVYPTVTYRYRMTVEVPVDGKIHSGSSVIEVKVTKQPQFLPGMGLSTRRIAGEAVYVDLGEGRNVFATLVPGPYFENRDYPAQIVPAHFDLSYQWPDLVKFPFLSGGWHIVPAEIPPRRSPAFVTFGDLENPATARVVEPADFPKVFGSRVGPPSVTFEMTWAPVTKGIYEMLPWLSGYIGVTSKTGEYLPWTAFVVGEAIQ